MHGCLHSFAVGIQDQNADLPIRDAQRITLQAGLKQAADFGDQFTGLGLGHGLAARHKHLQLIDFVPVFNKSGADGHSGTVYAELRFVGQPRQKLYSERMSLRKLLRREKYVVIHAQTKRFRVVKYIIIFALLFAAIAWKGWQNAFILLVLMAALSIFIHFLFRWKSKGWTESWGPYKKLNLPAE